MTRSSRIWYVHSACREEENLIKRIQVTGFTDIAPLVREQTVKSILVLVTKLSERTINGDLLKYLAKTANDAEPGIRTNTTVCLGKIAKYIGQSVSDQITTTTEPHTDQ